MTTFVVIIYNVGKEDYDIHGPFVSYESAEAFADKLRKQPPSLKRVTVFELIPPTE